MVTKLTIIHMLQEGKIALPPLSFHSLQNEREFKDSVHDALIETSWQNTHVRFIAEIRALSTPKVLRDVVNKIKLTVFPSDHWPLIIMPYLSEEKLRLLEEEQISGIDLCGNGVVIVPGVLSVFRTGGKNRFTTEAPIKNIYRKKTSLVSRIFLLRDRFETVQEIHGEINRRSLLVSEGYRQSMSLATVSKALKSLEDDLIIERKEGIRLIQPDKLMEKLSLNFIRPDVSNRVQLKIADTSNLMTNLVKLSQKERIPLIATGTSSVSRYAVMQRDDKLCLYCPRVDLFVPHLDGSQSDRFPNLELIETTDENVFFDARYENNFWWASPVQVYLELMTGDKRDQDTAEQIKTSLMRNIGKGIQ